LSLLNTAQAIVTGDTEGFRACPFRRCSTDTASVKGECPLQLRQMFYATMHVVADLYLGVRCICLALVDALGENKNIIAHSFRIVLTLSASVPLEGVS
jgi:hypothetical protein